MKIKMLPVVLLLFQCSCLYLTKKKYKLNEPYLFQTKQQYHDFLREKNIFPDNNLLYLDAEGYGLFISDMMEKQHALVYLGCYLNDSIRLVVSDPLLKNPSCVGRIETECNQSVISERVDSSRLVNTQSIVRYRLRHLSDGKLFAFSEKNSKRTLFLGYSYSFGKYYDNIYKKIRDTQINHSDETSLYIVCVDPVHRLK